MIGRSVYRMRLITRKSHFLNVNVLNPVDCERVRPVCRISEYAHWNRLKFFLCSCAPIFIRMCRLRCVARLVCLSVKICFVINVNIVTVKFYELRSYAWEIMIFMTFSEWLIPRVNPRLKVMSRKYCNIIHSHCPLAMNHQIHHVADMSDTNHVVSCIVCNGFSSNTFLLTSWHCRYINIILFGTQDLYSPILRLSILK